MPASDSCDVQEYINGDVDLATCNDVQDKMWETFLSQLGQETEEIQEDEEYDDD